MSTEQINQNSDFDGDDFYDDASTSFPAIADLAPDGTFDRGRVGPGRLVAIWVRKGGTRKGDNGIYEYVETVTLVLDDGPDGNYFSEQVPQAPQRLDGFQHSTTGMVTRLKPRLTGKDAKGRELKYLPMVGRINTQVSKVAKDKAAYSISPPEDADRVILNFHRDMIIGINRELKADDEAAVNQEAFE